MATRKHIKKQHRLQREEAQRSSSRSRTLRLVLGFGVPALVLAAVAALTFAFAPWSDSGVAEESLPALSLTVGDNYFRPEPLRLNAGRKYELKMHNEGRATHDVWMAGSDGKTDTGDDIRTDPIPGGGSATEKIQYDSPGTYYFVCTFHGGQGGTLIVEEPVAQERSP